MSETASTIVWLREDLRLGDNPALTAAIADGLKVIPLYILEEGGTGNWSLGAASRWWLHMSLKNLKNDLEAMGSRLILRRGNPRDVLRDLIGAQTVKAVYWNRCYTPHSRMRDENIKNTLKNQNITARSFKAALLWEPWEISTGAGAPYTIFSPFWKALLTKGAPAPPLPTPSKIASPHDWPASDALGDWDLLPTGPDWSHGLRKAWQPGETRAITQIDHFLGDAADHYKNDRDLPAVSGTSRLSAHLHFGEISPRQVWQRVQHHMAAGNAGSDTGSDAGAMAYLRELGWREFCHSLLYYHPDMPEKNLKSRFDAFPWENQTTDLKAWQQGKTGYPIVDAGMRELWCTGWMHNRVRMIAASFLIKHLMIDWREGEKWFWDTLVDADLANNAAGWQWVAGSGADASPYFRIFNPVLQGQKFDANGDYVRRWVPELAKLPPDYIHAPWEAPDSVLRNAGVSLGASYPQPIVRHSFARQRALDAYKTLKS